MALAGGRRTERAPHHHHHPVRRARLGGSPRRRPAHPSRMHNGWGGVRGVHPHPRAAPVRGAANLVRTAVQSARARSGGANCPGLVPPPLRRASGSSSEDPTSCQCPCRGSGHWLRHLRILLARARPLPAPPRGAGFAMSVLGGGGKAPVAPALRVAARLHTVEHGARHGAPRTCVRIGWIGCRIPRDPAVSSALRDAPCPTHPVCVALVGKCGSGPPCGWIGSSPPPSAPLSACRMQFNS